MRAFLVTAVLLVSRIAAATPDTRALFRQHNPQHLTALDVDAKGHIRHVRTDDAELAGDEEDVLRGWLQLNADFFGGRAEDNEPRRGAGALAYYLFDDQDQITGAAVIHRGHGIVDIAILRAVRSADTEAHALIGTRHVQTLRIGRAPLLDCKMGHSSCQPQVTATRTRSVVLTEDEVGAQLQLRTIGGAVRLVVCVSAEGAAPEGVPDLLSISLSGFPFALDAATGARLAVASCVPDL